MTDEIKKIKDSVVKQKKALGEINSVIKDLGSNNKEKKDMAAAHVDSLKNEIKKEGINVIKKADELKLAQPLVEKKEERQDDKKEVVPTWLINQRSIIIEKKLKGIERETLKRLKETGEKEIPHWLLTTGAIVLDKKKKANPYIKSSNSFFAGAALKIIRKGLFKDLQEDLIKSGMNVLPKSYISLMLFSTMIAFFISVLAFVFFLFYNFVATPPFVMPSTQPFSIRLLETFWIIFVFPILTFLVLYFYPSTERSSIEKKINLELPFATINMAAISGSMIDPTKIFSIIVMTKEYPTLEKEFLKIINGVNIMGYDLVTILKNSAFNSSSRKLRNLFNGLATTISSGGDMPKFFDERAKTLLFEYNLEKEKSNKAAETFMDIYISVVIAAPMILMLLLIIMQVSGLGIALSTSMITLIVVMGVLLVNAVFLTFLHIKQQNE